MKFGALRDPASGWVGFDARPAAVKTFLAYSLKRLGLDHIDIYRPARLDPKVPIEETVGAIADMVKAGYVRYIGLSEVGAETLRRAAAVHPICDLQIEYSLISRGIEAQILPTARELGIAITAYGVLSRGLISGHWRKEAIAPGDFRAHSPRFQGANVDANLALVESLRRVAEAMGISVAQAAIAWVAQQGEDIVPVIGARRRDRLSEALGSLGVTLSAKDLAAIEARGAAGRGRRRALPRGGHGQSRQREMTSGPEGFRPSGRGGAPVGIRTPNLLIRSQMLYPVELRAPEGGRKLTKAPPKGKQRTLPRLAR